MTTRKLLIEVDSLINLFTLNLYNVLMYMQQGVTGSCFPLSCTPPKLLDNLLHVHSPLRKNVPISLQSSHFWLPKRRPQKKKKKKKLTTMFVYSEDRESPSGEWLRNHSHCYCFGGECLQHVFRLLRGVIYKPGIIFHMNEKIFTLSMDISVLLFALSFLIPILSSVLLAL